MWIIDEFKWISVKNNDKINDNKKIKKIKYRKNNDYKKIKKIKIKKYKD